MSCLAVAVILTACSLQLRTRRDAMENQGLCTYAPQMLLLSPNSSVPPPEPLGNSGRLVQAQLIVFVVQHEILHQWFGDTVTMRDWTQEYLNEGFARMFQVRSIAVVAQRSPAPAASCFRIALPVDRLTRSVCLGLLGQSYAANDLVPEWDALCLTGHSQARSNSFFEFTYEVGMTFDATGTAPAVVYPLPGGGDVPPFPPAHAFSISAARWSHEGSQEDPTKAPLFSRIFYEKGATLNRMVALHLGFSAWDHALASHLRQFRWSNPTVEDLMRSLDGAFEAAGSPSAMSAMLPWLERPGFPVVTLSVYETQAAGWSVRASQRPISPYIPTRASEPWWIPLRISVGGAAPFNFEFNTTEAVAPVPTYAVGGQNVNGTAAPTCVGDPTFHGMFLVRYSDRAQWDARIAWAASERVNYSYVRALVFQIILLTSMAHEPVALLSSTISMLTPRLVSDSERKIGGFAGTGDFVTMILQRAALVAAVLNGCPNASDAAMQLGRNMAALAGPLSVALGWEDRLSSGQTDKAAVTNLGPPWPQQEDAQTEFRDRKRLRPVVLMSAVVAGDSATVASGLALFRALVTNGTVVDAQVARAAYFNAVRWGTAEDKTALERLLNMTAKTRPSSVPDILFGLSAGATDPSTCAAGLSALRLHTTTAELVPALANVLQLAPACHAATWDVLASAAQALWASDGAAATPAILATISVLGGSALPAASALISTQNATTVSSEDSYAALTQIRINGDLCAANSGE